jgi:signal transduction histidine kinase
MLRLAAELLSAETPVAAVRATAHLCFEQVGCPIAGLLPDPSGVGWFVAAAHGIGARKRTELGRVTREMSARNPDGSPGGRLASRLAAIADHGGIDAIEAGDAVLLVVDAAPEYFEFLRTAGFLLCESLDHLGTVEWAHLRNDNLDLAIAWTAHELKGPLVGARAALDHVLDADQEPGGRELLRRTREELDQLAELVDPLLRWSTGSGSLHKKSIDLVQIVRDAVASCRLESHETEVSIEAPQVLRVRADAPHLRGAIANVVRNALAYSPQASPVKVVVESAEGVARVRVRDQGPGVTPAESRRIFDPFARGTAGRGSRGGQGLGLFIARRIVEAHGGSIGLRSGRNGSTFCIQLPLAEDGRSACAS